MVSSQTLYVVSETQPYMTKYLQVKYQIMNNVSKVEHYHKQQWIYLYYLRIFTLPVHKTPIIAQVINHQKLTTLIIGISKKTCSKLRSRAFITYVWITTLDKNHHLVVEFVKYTIFFKTSFYFLTKFFNKLLPPQATYKMRLNSKITNRNNY